MSKPKTLNGGSATVSPIEYEAKEGLTDTVYCRRHRRTKPVPKGWNKTCTYLCSKCYEALTAHERQAYAPMEYHRKTHSAEAKPENQHRQKTQTHALKTTDNSTSQRETHHSGDNRSEVSATFTDLRDVMPKYSIKCLRCQKTSPCHYHWFSMSKVLCPSCYSEMKQWDRDEFHRIHNNDRLKAPSTIPSAGTSPQRYARTRPQNVIQGENQEDQVMLSRRFSARRLIKMTKRELLDAVRKGYVSRPRAKIELHRRKAAEYYNMMPDVQSVVV